MKTILLCSILLIGINGEVNAQKTEKGLFVRVYDLNGKKMGKGRVKSITDSTLVLRRSYENFEFKVAHIGFIRTKRSFGNNAAIGSVIGAVALGVVGGSLRESDGYLTFNSNQTAVIGGILGAGLGAGFGGLSGIFKKRTEFTINGSSDNLKLFRDMLNKSE